VNPDTTTQKLRTQLLHGWLVSCILHGLVLVSFLPLFRQSLMTVPPEPFHWDVALVQSSETAKESAETIETTKPVVPKPPDRTATASLADRRIRQAAPSAERITSLAPTIETPVTPTSMPDSPSSVISPSETATTSIPNELPPAPAQATELPRQQTDTPIDPMTGVSAGTETHSPTTETARPSPLPATTSDTAAVSAVRLDYGWLQQAVFRRLEELKRSSRPSLDDSRHLKVTVKAVVSREGTLLDSSVAKSSGLDHIDQEAMALVQRAFPMQLDRTLDRQQIVMRIPISYSRE